MRDPIHFRIAGYLATIVMHGVNIWDTSNRLYSHKHDPEIWQFYLNKHLFLTNLNVAFQISYATLGLTCDILTLTKKDDNIAILDKMKSFRDFVFAGLVFPPTMLVFTMFWSLYMVNPLLVTPPFIHHVIRPINNHVVHTLIVPVVMWEVACQPRCDPGLSAHLVNYGALLGYKVVYTLLIFYAYFMKGVWIYPYLKKSHGTILFPMSFVLSLVLITISYIGQWWLSEAIWGERVEDSGRKNAKKLS